MKRMFLSLDGVFRYCMINMIDWTSFSCKSYPSFQAWYSRIPSEVGWVRDSNPFRTQTLLYNWKCPLANTHLVTYINNSIFVRTYYKQRGQTRTQTCKHVCTHAHTHIHTIFGREQLFSAEKPPEAVANTFTLC